MRVSFPGRRRVTSADAGPAAGADLVARSLATAEFTVFRSLFLKSGAHYWLQENEMALLFGVGAFLPGEGRLVEIGAFEGASAAFLAAGLKYRGNGRLYSIDPHMGMPPYMGAAPHQFTHRKFLSTLEKCGVSGFVQSIVSESVSAASVWPATRIDAVLIDGDHSYLGALKDFESWAPKVRDGGLILIDDVDEHALPELKDLMQDIRLVRGIEADTTIGGVAVLRKQTSDDWGILHDLRAAAERRSHHRPWDLSHVQDLKPTGRFNPTAVVKDLQEAYQLSFLSRCLPGDYGVTSDSTADDVAMVDALVADRRDGRLVVIGPDSEAKRCRLIVAPVSQVPGLVHHLMPGGVMIGRSALEDTIENALAERQIMLSAGLEGCGWAGAIHWGIAKPHHLSPEAIATSIRGNME
jgi:predicted O-methyltransferase YrrM